MSDQLTSSASKVFYTGTHRTRMPEDTWEVMRPHLRRYGVTRVADVTGLDVIGIPVCMAVRPLSRTLSVSQGKGHSLLLAKISAVMESIELWHAEYGCPPADVRATPATELGLPYSLDRLDIYRGGLVGDRTALDWLTGTGLCTGRPVLVPHHMIHMARNLTPGWSPLGMRNGSNGLASGNDLAEATLHAIYEVLERNSLEHLTKSVEGRITVDPATVDEPTCAELIDRIRATDAVFEITMVPNRWGLPCFVAYVWSYDFPVFSVGTGAHSSVGVALSRAITEAVQSRLTAIAGSRDDLAPMYAHVQRGTGLKPVGPPELVPFADVADRGHVEFDDVTEEVSWISRRIEEHTGVEPILVDLSTADDFAVVKVVAPGLRFADRHVVPRPRY
ncbi:YcaO-like family protein [Streptomyces sp. NPDC058964]|uniref:YcaO-like family protein n=1 Tax=Streptomyces sp. NPDC058964 TaxID=3346681 RepID=UPI0036BC53D1